MESPSTLNIGIHGSSNPEGSLTSPSATSDVSALLNPTNNLSSSPASPRLATIGEDQPSPSSPLHEIPAVAPRKWKTRARTGCLVCRIRKVKCDERHPSCRNCTRGGRSCVYGTPGQRGRPEVLLNLNIDSMVCPEDQTIPGTDSNSPQWEPEITVNNQFATPQSLTGPMICGDMSASSDALRLRPQNGGLAPYLQIHSQPDGFLSTPGQQYASPPLQDEASIPEEEDQSAARFQRTSQVISLTLCLDKFIPSEAPTEASFSYFTEEVDCPFLTPFDTLNWKRIKQNIAQLGVREVSVARSILAIQAIYRAQVDRLPMNHAMTLYQAAISSFKFIVGNDDIDFDIALIDAFLLFLFQLFLPNQDNPTFNGLDSNLMIRIEAWLLNDHLSPVAVRICTWLQLLDTAAKRGGSPSLLLDSVFNLLSENITDVPSLASLESDQDPGNILYDTISTPIFSFYVKLQRVSNRVADVSHYRRSRVTGADQAEVNGILNGLKDDLYSLWETRPGPLRLEPKELREYFNPSISEPIVSLAGVCLAAYFAELIVIGRTLGDPIFPSDEARQGMQKIRAYVDGDWNSFDGNSLNPGYLRALFLYGVECFDRVEAQWAADRLRQIKDPISRGGFFASFIDSHGESQRAQKRRVTMKYFCYQNFGVPVPFL